MDLLKDFVIEIDPLNKLLIFWDPDKINLKKKAKHYKRIPFETKGQKVYIPVILNQENGTTVTTNLLLDTGASLALWIAPSSLPGVRLPSKTMQAFLGQGLSGEITGINGRIPSIEVGSFKIKNPVVSYPDSASIALLSIDEKRNGSIGNELLRRFHLFIDVEGRQIFLRSNRNFRNSFTYNKSGMEVDKPYLSLPIYHVYSVIPGSPADSAGVKPGDIIEYINYLPAVSITLDEINLILHGQSGRKVRLRVSRGDKKLILKLTLTEQI
jgi:hypothetical protein